MKAPCETVVTVFLPFIRAYIAGRLVTKFNYTQNEAAKMMDISQPAISLYLQGKRGGQSGKRGLDEFIPSEFDQMIDEMVEKIRKGEDVGSLKDLICEVCPMTTNKSQK
jgi:predicted transcriptional regulator